MMTLQMFIIINTVSIRGCAHYTSIIKIYFKKRETYEKEMEAGKPIEGTYFNLVTLIICIGSNIRNCCLYKVFILLL